MSRIVVFVMAAIVFAVALVSIGALFFRHSRSVTAAELLAQIPASMRVEDREYPDREKRFESILKLSRDVAKSDVDRVLWFPKSPADKDREARVDKDYEPLLTEVRFLLDTGPLQFPNVKRTRADGEALLSLERAIAISTADKIARHDQANAYRLANLGFQLGRGLRLAGGRMWDYSLARNAEWIALNAFWTLGRQGMLSAAEREEVLKKIPADRGVDPELAAMFGRNLRQATIPYLAQASRRLMSSSDFDPIETMRLYGQLYQQAADDATDPSDWSWEHCGAMIDQVAEDLGGRAASGTISDWTSSLSKSLKGNRAGQQLLARSEAAHEVQYSRQLAAYRNMIRATLLLEAGKPANLRDPLGHGDLQVDPQRRIVWSVGLDGVDDDGRYRSSTKYGNDLILRY